MAWHYTRHTRRTRVPAHLISVSVLPHAAESSRARRAYDLTADRWAAVYSQRRGGRWRTDPVAEGSTVSAWWDWLCGIVRPGRTVWIVATQADQAATMLGIWPATDDGLVTWGRLQFTSRTAGKSNESLPPDRCTLILSSPPTILHHHLAGGSVCWISTSNYLQGSLADLAAAVGLPAPAVWGQGTRAAGYALAPREGAAVVSAFMLRMIDEWAAADRGPWKATASQLAHSWWRKSHHTHPILIHDDPAAHRLERAALAGGRAEVYCVARIGGTSIVAGHRYEPPRMPPAPCPAGPITRLDIRSCYASLLASELFPIRLDKVHVSPSVRMVKEELAYGGGIASVRIRTDVPLYPVKIPARRGWRQEWTGDRWARVLTGCPPRTTYPCGTFDCALAGPELRRAIDFGHVEQVYEFASYRHAPAFASFASACLALRESSRSAGNIVAEQLYKLMANAFAGKWAARPGGWTTDAKLLAPEDWGEFTLSVPDDPAPVRCRSIGGIVQRYTVDPDGIKGFPAILAYLTSYARLRLWDIMRVCPARSVVQCDTDGLYVLPDGLDAIRAAGLLNRPGPGSLRIVGEYRTGQFLAARHYWLDGEWTCAGVAGGWTWSGDGMLEDHQYSVRPGGMGRTPDNRIKVTARSVDVYGVRPLGTYDRLGWKVPEVLPFNETPQPDDDQGLPFSS